MKSALHSQMDISFQSVATGWKSSHQFKFIAHLLKPYYKKQLHFCVSHAKHICVSHAKHTKGFLAQLKQKIQLLLQTYTA